MLLQGHTSIVTSVSYSPDGTRLASASHDSLVMVWDVELGVQLFVLKGHRDWVYSVSFSSDGTKIVSGSRDRFIIVWDSASGCEFVRMERQSRPLTGVCFLPAMSDYLLK